MQPLARLTLAALALCALAARLPAQPAEDPFRPPAIVAQDVPVIPPELIERLRQYQAVRGAAFLGWSPDGAGMLISTRFAETNQLHRVYEPGGRREQITFFNEPVTGQFIRRAADGALLLSISRGGNENSQLYFLDRATARAVLLTDGASRNIAGPMTRDGTRIIIHSNQRNPRDTDLYLADPRRPGSMKMLKQVENEFWSASDWSHDAQRLLLARVVSINETHPAILEVATGKLTMLPVPGGGPAATDNLKFTADGRGVFMATDARGEFQELALLDLGSKTFTWLTEDISWDVDAVEVDDKTGRVACTTNEDGASALFLFEPVGQRFDRRRLSIPLGIVSGLEFSPDGARLGFSLARPDAPTDAYSLELATGTLTRWTYSEVGGLDPATFITPRRIEFASFDGRKIPAYWFQPRRASRDKPAPVLIQIHGGPEGQYRPAFNGIEQFYLNDLGMAVIQPNVRGSAGYGKTYLKLDNAQLREDSVRDIGALLDWIATQPELDASRVAVMGGSYGGYMVLATLTHYSSRLRAGVDIVGIASFKSFLKNTSPYRQDLRRVEYGDERDPEMQAFFDRIDPLNNAEKITAALLVAHGRNDPRVPFTEAQQIAQRVRAAGRKVWTIYADNEGHGFAKKPNRDYLQAAIAMFFKEAL